MIRTTYCASIRGEAPGASSGRLFVLRGWMRGKTGLITRVAKLLDSVHHAPRTKRGSALGTVQIRRACWPSLREKKAAFHFNPPLPLGRTAAQNSISRLREAMQDLFQMNHMASFKQANDLSRCIKNPSPSFLCQRETFPRFGNGGDAEYAKLCNFPWCPGRAGSILRVYS